MRTEVNVYITADQAIVTPREIQRASTAIIGVTRIVGPPTIGIAALGTHQQPLQQVAGPPPGQAASAPVLLQLFGDGGEEGFADQRRHGDRDPGVLAPGDRARPPG